MQLPGSSIKYSWRTLKMPKVDIERQYNDGLEGWIWNDKVAEEWTNYCSQEPELYSINPELKDLHRKRHRVLLYLAREKHDPGCHVAEAQETGDCFLAGTLVRMADGTEKAIEEIQTGEYVVSHTGQDRVVLSTYKKNYSGELFEIEAESSYRKLKATKDHKFLIYPELWPKKSGGKEYRNRWKNRSEKFLWKPIKELNTEDHTLYPKLKHGKEILSDDLCWLVGLFLAEGSTCYQDGKPNRITFNLSSEELDLAKKTKQIIFDYFGVEAIITSVPSKPSVLYVRSANAKFTRWMKSWSTGNTYSKRVDKKFFNSTKTNKIALLKGWLDGDGCLQLGKRNRDYLHCKVSGVSVCEGLTQDMHTLSVSCGLKSSICKKEAYKQSKSNYTMYLYGSNVFEVYPETIDSSDIQVKLRDYRLTKLGQAARVKSISSEQFDGVVYCIEVEEDHSFIAEGFAVHNCTAMGSRGARDTSRAVEVESGEPEIWYKRTATEPTYGMRGHSGGGMDPYSAAKFESEYGFLFRDVYKDANKNLNLDLTKYLVNVGINWGKNGTPEAIKEECKKHNVGQWLQPKTLEEALDCLAAGHGIHSGQKWGTSSSQNSDGINRFSKRWNHDMATEGYDLTEEYFKEQVVFVPNTWGDFIEPNPIWLEHEDVYGKWPGGIIVVPIAEYEDYFVNSGSIHAYSNIKGFAIKELPSIETGIL